jgi:hypothetical protein
LAVLIALFAIPLFLIGSTIVIIFLCERRRFPQSIALALLVCTSAFLGTLIEKGLYVNRHIDLCTDDTAQYYREYNGFDPFCSQVKLND